MKIIEWNCQGAFRLKNTEILNLKPDIIIVPECENEEKLQFGSLTPRPNDFLWHGDTGKKGIGIFSYSNFKFKLLKDFNQEYRYVVPIEVTDGTSSFLLFAVWAMDNKQNPLARYIAQVWLAINYYQSLLKENTIIIGDLNSNQIWDEKERLGNHSDVVNFLKEYEIESLYHKQYNEEHGNESLNTFFMYRNVEKAYHIDYAFASHNIIKNGYNLTIEDSSKWINKSDHAPMVLDIYSIESVVNFKNTYQDYALRHLSGLTEITRVKFQQEVIAIKKFARDLDTNIGNNEYAATLVKKIELLKQIDKLISRLNNIDRN